MKAKTRNDFKKIKYKVVLEEKWDEDEKERYYIAYHTEISRFSCYGRGKTPDEAIQSLNRERYDLFEILTEKGMPIPEPSKDEFEDLPSGKFVVRTDPILHRRLNLLAKKMGVSLNLLVNRLISQNLTAEEIDYDFTKRFDRIESKLGKTKVGS